MLRLPKISGSSIGVNQCRHPVMFPNRNTKLACQRLISDYWDTARET